MRRCGWRVGEEGRGVSRCGWRVGSRRREGV